MVKKGFSLAEALVVMAIISIFFAAAGKIMTQKPKPIKQQNPHGYFECYLDGATLKQSSAIEEAATDPIDAEGGACTFEPPKGVAFFNVNTYGPAFYSDFEPNVNNTINIKINNAAGAKDFVKIYNGDKTFYIESDDNPLSKEFDNQKESAKVYFQAIHPKSQIYNNGNVRTGIMFSW